VKHICTFLATGCYSGYLPIAPGTWGTLVAMPLFWLLGSLSPFVYLVTLVGFIFLSIWAADYGSVKFEREDPPQVVIDEIAGYLVTMAFFKPSLVIMIIGFFMFRLFDITKPQPVAWCEKKFSGGTGIVLDDVMAGIYANLAIHLLIFIDTYFKINLLTSYL
jgi:phosphatidylglycerophosphatase A